MTTLYEEDRLPSGTRTVNIILFIQVKPAVNHLVTPRGTSRSVDSFIYPCSHRTRSHLQMKKQSSTTHHTPPLHNFKSTPLVKRIVNVKNYSQTLTVHRLYTESKLLISCFYYRLYIESISHAIILCFINLRFLLGDGGLKSEFIRGTFYDFTIRLVESVVVNSNLL